MPAMPLHVQAIAVLVNSLGIIMGLRDMFAPGMPIPWIPDDDKYQLIWGFSQTKKGGLVATPIEGAMRVIVQEHGVLFLFVALFKLATVFSHMSEGTFLRRNLLILNGLACLMYAYVCMGSHATLKDTIGFDNSGVVAMFAIEGGVYRADALLRKRKTKAA